MRIVIAGGGTGGHLYAGIAIARELLKERADKVLFVGTRQGIEAKVLPKEGLPVRFITVGKLKGMKFFPMLKTLLTLPVSLAHSLALLLQEKPDLVIGVGGYASGPVAVAAWAARIPVLIVEPNSCPGLANRKLGMLARRVILCFPGTGAQGFFPSEKTVTLGPLVRKGIDQADRRKALAEFKLRPGRYTVLVMGGSGGAHAINMAMKQAAGHLKNFSGFQILHQTGEKDGADVAAGYREAGLNAVVLPYIHEMPAAYAAADLVVSRAGATTVAELAVCGKRAILIPFPFAADNHQEYNASMLAARGAAEVVVQNNLNPESLAAIIKRYVKQGERSKIERMANTAAEEIAGICRTYVQKD